MRLSAKDIGHDFPKVHLAVHVNLRGSRGRNPKTSPGTAWDIMVIHEKWFCFLYTCYLLIHFYPILAL